MSLVIVRQSAECLAEYSQIPIGFTVAEVLDDAAIDAALHGAAFAAIPTAAPYWKDYDSYPGAHPTDWAERFDVAAWKFFTAFLNGQRAGGAALVPCGCADLRRIGERADSALLWDLRVAPALRRRGVGAALLEQVIREARLGGATQLRVETQQINVPACRLYAACGFRLARVRRHAYPALPSEVQLVWSKRL